MLQTLGVITPVITSHCVGWGGVLCNGEKWMHVAVMAAHVGTG